MAAERGMHDQFAARSLHRIGRVEMGVPGQLAYPEEQKASGERVAAVSQVQQHVLGQRADAVLVGRGAHQPEVAATSSSVR